MQAETSSSTTTPHKVPLGEKIAFGIGMLANQMFPAALGVFMVVLVEGLDMSPWIYGLLAFLPRLSDALTDPAMGFITDNTKSRWGRRKPYIIVGAIIAGLSYMFMWQLHPQNSELYNILYFLIFALVYYLGMTILATPFVAMGYEMSDDFHERTRIMAVSQWIGQLAWVIVPWFWLVIYNDELFENPAHGARELAIWVGITCMLMAMVPAFFCTTRHVDPKTLKALSAENISKNTASLIKGVREAFSNGPFVRVCIATFFVFNAFNTVAGLSFFIIVHYMFSGNQGAAGTWPMWFGTASALCTCFLVIPIITFMSKTIGKKQTFLVSQSISLIGYILFWFCFQPATPWLMLLPMPLFAFGIGGLFTIMMSMTADICDLDELNTGERREGVFGAVYWWMVKFGFAAAALGGGLIMQFVGFDPKAETQTTEAMQGLKLAYSVVPSIGTTIAIFVMLGYDLNETRSNEIRKQIEMRK